MSAASRLLVLALLGLCLAPAVLAQEKPLAEEPAAKTELPGDQKVYVPFKNLKDVFEKEGQGVFVPFDEFLKLWEANLDRRPVPADPPMPFLVTRASYEGAVEGDVATVKAVICFETFTKGYGAVPLGFSGISFMEATIAGAPATLEGGKDGYRVLVPEAGAYELAVKFVTPIAKAEDLRVISFRMPPTPVSRLTFDIPEEGAKVTVEPNLATTRTEPGSGVTRVMAYVGAADALTLSWKPRPKEVEKGEPLVFADSLVAASVEETAVRIRAEVSLAIHRAPAEEFSLKLDPEANVLFVEGDELRQWEYEAATKTIKVKLLKPATSACRLVVTLEVPRPETGTVRVPSIAVLKAARDQGLLLVRAPDTVKVLPEATGLARADFESLPPAAPRDLLLFAWRWPAHPFALSLAVSRVDPVVDAGVKTTATLDERRLQQVDELNFTVTRVGIFEVRVALPEGVTVTDVSREIVDDWRVLPDRTLVLDLSGRRIGAFTIAITTARDVSIADQPVDIELPVLTPLNVRRLEGAVGLVREDGLKVETKVSTGCEPLDAAAFGGGAALAYSYRAAGRKVVLSVVKREPEVTAEVVTELRAEQNRVAVKAKIRYTVRFAGVDSFSFTLPAVLKEKVKVTGNNIREKPLSDVEGGLVRQKVVLQGKVIGEYAVDVEWDLPYEGLSTGESTSVAVPSLAIENVLRELGYYAVWRDPALEIDAVTDALEPVDPRELPAGSAAADVFLAFKWLTRPHALTLSIAKHDVLPVLAAVVHHMHLVTALNEEGTARTEMVLSLTNNGLQFLSISLPEGARPDTLEIWVPDGSGQFRAGKETPQAGAPGTILVRMPAGIGPDAKFYVKVTWARAAKVKGLIFHPFRFAAPKIEDGKVPVLGTSWFVFPPPDVKVTRAGGTLAWLDREGGWWAQVLRAFSEIFDQRRLPVVLSRARAGAGLPRGIADLATAGQTALSFGGRSRDPVVEISYADPGAFAGVLGVCFIAVPAAAFIFLRRAKRTAKVAFVFGLLALALLLMPIAAPGLAEMLQAVFFGALAAAVLFLVLGFLGLFSRAPAATAAPAAPATPAGKES